MASDRKKIVVRNSVYSVINDLVNIPLKLLIISYMIAKLGIVEYGIYSLIQSLGGQIAQMTLSMPQGITKFIPEYLIQKLPKKINETLSTAFVLYLGIGVIVIILAYLFQPIIFTDFFKLQPDQFDQFSIMYWIAVIVFIGNHVFGIYPSFLNGLQRIDLVSKISMASNLVEVIIQFIILFFGGGLIGIFILMIFIDSATILAYIIYSKILFKPLKVRLTYFNFQELKKILNYSLQLQVSGFASQIVVDLPKWIITRLLGPGATGLYDVALKVVAILRKLLMRLVSPIMPAASELYALNQTITLQRLFLQSLRYLYLVGFPLFAFIFTFSYHLVYFWLRQGVDITAAASTMRWLTVCFWINLTVIPASYFLNGIGKPKYVMYSAMSTVILMLLLTPVSIYYWHYMGAVLAVFISWGVSSLLLHYYFFHTMQFKLRIIPIKLTIWYPFQVAILTGFFYLLLLLLPMKLSIFIPVCILVFFGYILILFWQKHLELYDLELIKPYLPSRLFLIFRNWVTP